MLAARMTSILPHLAVSEALETTMIHSVAGTLPEGGIIRQRPFRDPHHSASQPALVGGGMRVKPGEMSLAHNGVLFLDELPEFPRQALEALRQPLETGRVSIARANAHVTYPARVQLIAAMNPCRCGHFGEPELACSKAPKCAADYQNKLSGPLLDRFDLFVDVSALSPLDLDQRADGEPSWAVAERVATTRDRQTRRYDGGLNAHTDGDVLTNTATPDDDGRALLREAAAKLRLSARSYTRVLRVARTIADLAGVDQVGRCHVAEALSFRRRPIKTA
jgi:magnesium chelatase family protein